VGIECADFMMIFFVAVVVLILRIGVTWRTENIPGHSGGIN